MPAPTLVPPSSGGTIFANDVDSIMRWLQPLSTDTVTGSWVQAAYSTASAQFVGIWVPIAQRNSTPVSLGITQSSTPTNFAAASANHLDSTGFLIFSGSTGVNSNASFVGTYTITY